MGHALQIVDNKPISAAEARARLKALGDKPINASRLAREWGWSRARTRRLIDRCRAEGLISSEAIRRQTRRATASGDAASAEASTSDTPTPPSSATPAPQGTQMTIHQLPPSDTAGATDTPVNLNEPCYDDDAPPPPPTPHRDMPLARNALPIVLGTGAITLGAVGFLLNITFAHSLGRSELAAELLAMLGGALDVMTIVLPSVADNLWRRKLRSGAMAAWVIWGGCLTMTLIAASGFAATNIGDTGQERADIVSTRATLNEQLDHARTDRKTITEARAPAALQAAIQQEQASIPARNWKASAGCTDVTISARYCGTMNTLRQVKAVAERRDKLDGDISKAEDELRKLPPVVAADPGADMAAKLIRAITFGLVNATPASVQEIRIAGLTLAPALSGLLLMFAGLIWRTRRDDEPIEPIV